MRASRLVPSGPSTRSLVKRIRHSLREQEPASQMVASICRTDVIRPDLKPRTPAREVGEKPSTMRSNDWLKCALQSSVAECPLPVPPRPLVSLKSRSGNGTPDGREHWSATAESPQPGEALQNLSVHCRRM